MKRYIIGWVCFALIVFANEPSAFEAGDLDLKTPYGLTSQEEHIFKNKKEINKVKREILSIKSDLSQIDEKLQGAVSVIEGLEENYNKLKFKIEKLSKNTEKYDDKLDMFYKRVKKDINNSLVVEVENYEKIKNVLKELTSLIDSINASYVSREEFEEKMSKLKEYFEKTLKKEIKQKEFSVLDGNSAFIKAKRLYKQNELDKAKGYFAIAIKKRYKPATSNFYIGEICYKNGEFECAIKRYKKSVSIYSKSSFMPTLLLHTAISLEKIGKKKEAKPFYKSLISKYPSTSAAKIAKKKIKH